VSIPGHERRKFGRRVVAKPSTIVLQNGERIKSLVVDISEGGARIRTASPASLTKFFKLEIPEDDFVVDCEVVHVQSDAVGVKYTASPKRLSWLAKKVPLREQGGPQDG
jgi:hypothetical protein